MAFDRLQFGCLFAYQDIIYNLLLTESDWNPPPTALLLIWFKFNPAWISNHMPM